MWRACRLLNSWRRFAAMMASSPTRVSRLWFEDAGELMDGFEFPDILYRWKTQRGSRQKAAWVWRCSTGGLGLGLRRLALFFGGGGCVSLRDVAPFICSAGFRRWYSFRSVGVCRCPAGSHVLSLSGYPSHLTRYCKCFPLP